MVVGALSEAMRRALEEEMHTRGYEYQTEFARRYLAQGREEGAVAAARAALVALAARRLGELPASVAARISACAELDTLTNWIVEVGCAADPDAILTLFE